MRHFVLALVAIAATVTSAVVIQRATAGFQAARIQTSPRADLRTAREDYLLDNGGGDFALYPGAGYRGLIESKYEARSFEDLKSKVSRLPKGARIWWSPYNLDAFGKPFLFKQGQFDEFMTFCVGRSIELKVGDAETTKSLLLRLQNSMKEGCSDAGEKVETIKKLSQRRAKEGVSALIECLADRRKCLGRDDPWVARSAATALEGISGKHFDIDQERWRRWHATGR